MSVTLASLDECTGCGACKQICPKKAIEFKADEMGFKYPFIDQEKCINCGLCETTCPILHEPATHPIIKAYAVQNKDSHALQKSSSGGVFILLASEIIRKNGVVFGCVFNQKSEVVFTKAQTEEELKPMQGSKYVWADASVVYRDVRDELKQDRPVLFTGMPCQIAGLKKYLKKEYENLYLLDFLCGGSNSQMAWELYLQSIVKDCDREKLNFQFRDKEKSGTGVYPSYQLPKKKVYTNSATNSYFYAKLKKYTQRHSCFHCTYRGTERASDFTMGDYWGVEKHHPDLDEKAGVSIILLNTEKGRALFEGVSSMAECRETALQNIAEKNVLNLKNEAANCPIPKCQSDFFKDIQKKGWKAGSRKYLWTTDRMKALISTEFPGLTACILRAKRKILKK